MVGLCLCKVFDTVVEEPERSVARSRLADAAQLFFLLRAHDRQVAQLSLRLFHHSRGHGHDALCQVLSDAMTVERVVVLYYDAPRLYLDINLEFRYVQFEQLLSHRLACHVVARQYPHLIGIGDGRPEGIVGCNASEGIILVAQRVVKCRARLSEEVGHGDVADSQSQGQRVHKHAHRVGNPDVAAAAAHRAEIDIAVVGVARHHISRGCQEQMGGRNLLLPAECRGLVEVGRAYRLADESLFVGLWQVGRYLAGTLAGGQFLGKELLRRLERLALLSLLLVGHEVQVGVCLRFGGLSFQLCAYLADEQVGRASVEHQVMDVHEQMHRLSGPHHLEAVERRLLQVERLHELILISQQLLLAHLGDGAPLLLTERQCDAVVGCLDDGVALCGEVYAQLRMAVHHLLYGCGQLLRVCSFGEGEQVGDVIEC